MAPFYKIMKKSYRKKGYTSIALNPEMASRIEKILKKSGGKLSKYAQGAINKELEIDEMNQILSTYGKLDASEQYQKIKRLEGEVEKLKGYHITEKKVDEKFKKLKSKKIDDLEKEVKGFRGLMNQVIKDQKKGIEFFKTELKELEKTKK